MLDATRTYMGSVKGPMRGRDGNVHRGRPKEGLPAMISHLGTMISYVTGMLLARRPQKCRENPVQQCGSRRPGQTVCVARQ